MHVFHDMTESLLKFTYVSLRHAVAQLFEALRYKPMVSLEFFIDIILPDALGPWG